MKYKVKIGSPTLASLSAMSGAFVSVGIITPRPYKWILDGVIVLFWVWSITLLIRLSWRNRFLTFTEDTLVFPKQTIHPKDIKHIFVYERNRSFIIYFNERKLPISVAFKWNEEEGFRSELRQWTWKNGIQTKTSNIRRKAK